MPGDAVRLLVDHALHIVVGGFLIWFVWKAAWMFVRSPDQDLDEPPHHAVGNAAGGFDLHEGEDTRQ